MDIQPTPAQEAIRQKAAAFSQEWLAPQAARWDREKQFPEEACRECARRGLTGLTVPKEEGGPGAGTVAYSLAITEIAAGCSSTAVTVAVTSMVAETIARFGTPEQKKRYLPAILQGEFSCASFALSEPGAGSDAASLTTRARYNGDEVTLDGEKMWITSGSHAGVLVTWARSAEAPGARGITSFLVEPGDEGFEVGRAEEKMGLRASTTVALNFSNCTIPATRRLSEPGGGFRVAMSALDGGRIGVASQALGIARAAMDCAVRYIRERNASPSGDLKAHLAHMKAEFEAARLLILRAAWLKEQGLSFSTEAAMAKAYATEAANRICREAVQILGEEGCSRSYPVERLFRDCKVTTIYEGTSEIQRIVISRALLRA